MTTGLKAPPPRNTLPVLGVACARCQMNAGRIEDGALVYTVKHGGEHHTVRIDLKFLEKVLRATGENVVR